MPRHLATHHDGTVRQNLREQRSLRQQGRFAIRKCLRLPAEFGNRRICPKVTNVETDRRATLSEIVERIMVTPS
jgi:hypothetical protein